MFRSQGHTRDSEIPWIFYTNRTILSSLWKIDMIVIKCIYFHFFNSFYKWHLCLIISFYKWHICFIVSFPIILSEINWCIFRLVFIIFEPVHYGAIHVIILADLHTRIDLTFSLSGRLNYPRLFDLEFQFLFRLRALWWSTLFHQLSNMCIVFLIFQNWLRILFLVNVEAIDIV